MQTTSNDIKRRPTDVVLAVAFGVVAVVTLRLLWSVVRDTGAALLRGAPLGLDAALTGALAAGSLVLLTWLVLGVVLELLARVPGAVGRAAGALSAAVSPRVVRRAAALVLGVGLGVGAGTGGAQAAPARSAVAVVHDLAAVAVGMPAGPVPSPLPDPGWGTDPDPGWTPHAPVVRPQPDLAVLGARGVDSASGEVVVTRGDSLWAIAARHLGEGATDAEVAAAWPRWYAANRAVVGSDPDVLHPGQVLRVPDGAR